MEKAVAIIPFEHSFSLDVKKYIISKYSTSFEVEEDGIYKIFLRSDKMNEVFLNISENNIVGHYKASTFEEFFIQQKNGDIIKVDLPEKSDSCVSIFLVK